MPEQPITLPTGGGLPGIPGDHAPGNYLVDYDARTIRPVDTEPLPDVAQPAPSLQPASPVDITAAEQQQPA